MHICIYIYIYRSIESPPGGSISARRSGTSTASATSSPEKKNTLQNRDGPIWADCEGWW